MSVAAGSTVTLNCSSPVSTSVVHAEWEFRRLNTGRPMLIYDGSRINPELPDKYVTRCNLLSGICDLQINRLQADDVGKYRCYLRTKNIGAVAYVYKLAVIGA